MAVAWALDPATNLKTVYSSGESVQTLIATYQGFKRHRWTVSQLARSKGSSCQSFGFCQITGACQRTPNSLVDFSIGMNLSDGKQRWIVSPTQTFFAMMGKLGFDCVPREKYPFVELIQHLHHPGNSSGIVDNAAALLIGSEEKASP